LTVRAVTKPSSSKQHHFRIEKIGAIMTGWESIIVMEQLPRTGSNFLPARQEELLCH